MESTERQRPDVSYHHFKHSTMNRMLCTLAIRKIKATRDPIPFEIINETALVPEAKYVAALSFCSFDDNPTKEAGQTKALQRVDAFLRQDRPRKRDRFVTVFSDEDVMRSWLRLLRSREDEVGDLITLLQEKFRFYPHSWESRFHE